MKKIFKNLIYKIKNAKLITKIFLIILLITGGGLTLNHIIQKEEMIKIAKEHKKEMDEEVRYGDKDHHIKTITYEWNTVKHNPMGGFMLNGYVNGDKKLFVRLMIDKVNGKIECRVYTCSNVIDEWEGQGQ